MAVQWRRYGDGVRQRHGDANLSPAVVFRALVSPCPYVSAIELSLADLRQGVQQCFGILEVRGVKALGEPAVYLRQKLVRFCSLTLLLPQPP